MRLAITREISPAINHCELTHLSRQPIDLDLARGQHAAYEACLRALGCAVHRLPVAEDLPDSVFVEDCAVVLDEIAVITRPGASSRRAETAAVEHALWPYRPLRCIDPPATIDGGDVLRVGRTLYVGLSARTNAAGIDQLEKLGRRFGYSVEALEVGACLHLKSAVTEVAPRVLLVNRAWLPEKAFQPFERIDVDPSEPFAANALRIGHAVLYPAAFPRTQERLESRGISLRTVDVSELAKAEGAVTCCSLIIGDSGE